MPAMVAAMWTFSRTEPSPAKEAGRQENAERKAFSARASVIAPAFFPTRASRAWLSVSKPVSAMRAGGRPISRSLSKIAASGRSLGSTRGCFTPLWVKMAKSVTSEPEPEVVGMATSRMPSPEKKAMALAQSMALPPPRATMVSGRNRRTAAVPEAARATSGSGFTSVKYSVSWARRRLPPAPPPRFSKRRGR